MFWSVRKIRVISILTILCSVAAVFLASPEVVLGITAGVGENSLVAPVYDPDQAPEGIVRDARRLAKKLFSKNQDARDGFVSQLLGTYLASREKDVVIIFNPGGWGGKSIHDSPYWPGVASGIQDELQMLGYSSLFLNYRRSSTSLTSYVDELMAILDLYPDKAMELACRVEFLTEHIPDLKVVVAGESNGTIICNKVIEYLRNNPRVFSIQTGTPFWHKSQMMERALIINDNGLAPDTMSNGNFFAIVSANLEMLYGFSKPGEGMGTIFNCFAAPGHSYHWQSDSVQGRIKSFLSKNFGDGG